MTNRIFEFDPAVYPFRLWVGVDVPSDEITGKFWAYNIVDGTISDIENSDLSGGGIAWPRHTLSAAKRTMRLGRSCMSGERGGAALA